ncbi:hypothetical protein Bbelb_037500 [Branchiostoma belcheri]|nr:hypothetical protein Bbelb_037500 [Branchiostoma belcheri]
MVQNARRSVLPVQPQLRPPPPTTHHRAPPPEQQIPAPHRPHQTGLELVGCAPYSFFLPFRRTPSTSAEPNQSPTSPNHSRPYSQPTPNRLRGVRQWEAAQCSEARPSSALNWEMDFASATLGSSSFHSLMVRGKNESL